MEYFLNNTDTDQVFDLFKTLEEQLITILVLVMFLLFFKLKKLLTSSITAIRERRNSLATSSEETINYRK